MAKTNYFFVGNVNNAPILFETATLYAFFHGNKIIKKSNDLLIAASGDNDVVNFPTPELTAIDEYMSLIHRYSFGSLNTISNNDFFKMLQNITDENSEEAKEMVRELQNTLNQYPNHYDNIVLLSGFAVDTPENLTALAREVFANHTKIIVPAISTMVGSPHELNDDDVLEVLALHLYQAQQAALNYYRNLYDKVLSTPAKNTPIQELPQFPMGVGGLEKLSSPMRYLVILSSLWSCNAPEWLAYALKNPEKLDSLQNLIVQENGNAPHNDLSNMIERMNTVAWLANREPFANNLLNAIFQTAQPINSRVNDLFVNQNAVLSTLPNLRDFIIGASIREQTPQEAVKIMEERFTFFNISMLDIAPAPVAETAAAPVEPQNTAE